eukprot:jgi/Botrbrau1/5488/Bobra.27_1s0027.2
MSSDEDVNELAELRAQRASRLGSSGLTLSAIRSKQQWVRNEEYSAEDPLRSERNSGAAHASDRLGGSDEDLDPEEHNEDLALKHNLPTSFGKVEQMVPTASSLNMLHRDKIRAMPVPAVRKRGPERISTPAELEDLVGPARPAGISDVSIAGDRSESNSDDTENGAGDSDDDDMEEDPYRLPISHEVNLEGQKKVVTALAADPAGSRLLAGSRDYTLRMFDFNGMNSTMRSFRSLEPSEGHPVHALSWSPTGDAFLVVTGSSQIKVYDRDGIARGESIRGDMYIRDARNTKGHVSPTTSGHWHPIDRYTGITSSEDGTVRVWDLYNLLQKTVIKPKLEKPGRVAVTSCQYNSDGRLIVAGLMDGSLQLWDVKGNFGRSAAVGQILPPKPQMVVKQDWRYVSGGGQVAYHAHARDCEVTSLAFSADDNTLLSRATDNTLKVWDLRNFKEPCQVHTDLPTLHAETSVIFSPDETLMVTGVAAGRDGSGGALVFFDRVRGELVSRLAMPSSVVSVLWHSRLNQIFVGLGDNKQGETRVLYDPVLSTRGVLGVAARKPRPKNPFDLEVPLVIHAPHALPMYREPRPKKHKTDSGAVRSSKVDAAGLVSAAAGSGGRIGAPAKTLLTQFIMKNQGKLTNPADEDIRVAILRHQDGGQFSGFTEAYAKTQPQRIFATEEQEEGQS